VNVREGHAGEESRARLCSACGHPVQAGARFCGACGAPLAHEPAT